MNTPLTPGNIDHDVAVAPAPWDLLGQGYIFLLRLPQTVLDEGSFAPPGLQRAGRGQLAIAMFVDYAASNVGPYHELLYIPGKFRFDRQCHWSITRIFVSTWASVVNGQANWGIPKDRCDFEVHYGATDRVALSSDQGRPFAELELQAFGPRLPAPMAWTPRSWRTLSQVHQGQRYTYVPEASGGFRFARVRRWRFDPALFPDLAQGRVLAALRITDFAMRFPPARIEAA